jgi:hypothetical protein
VPYWLNIVLQFSILIAAVIAYLKRKRIHKKYLPFIISVWINLGGCIVNQIANFFFSGNAVSSNIYFIIFCLLVLWQFRCWELFSDRPLAYYILGGLFILVWLFDNLVLGTLFAFNPYARIINSVAIVLMSIHLFSGGLQDQSKVFWKNSKQIILVAYILFFTVKFITEFFWQYGRQLGDSFLINIIICYQGINFFVNLLYALATLWIPVNTRYSWLSR